MWMGFGNSSDLSFLPRNFRSYDYYEVNRHSFCCPLLRAWTSSNGQHLYSLTWRNSYDKRAIQSPITVYGTAYFMTILVGLIDIRL